MKNYIVVLFVLVISSTISAQAPGIQWQKSFGGTADEEGVCIKVTSDGGYIAGGYSYSINGDVIGNHGSFDYWVVKFDNLGLIQWQRTLGGTGPDFGNAISQTSDGGYIITGYAQSNDGDVTGYHASSINGDYWVVKLSNLGLIQWQKCFGGFNTDLGWSLLLTMDGGYIAIGESSSGDGDIVNPIHGGQDVWIVKMDNAGSIQWEKSYGGTGNDNAYSIIQTSTGDYVFAGRSTSNDGDVTMNHGGYDYWIVKLNNAGIIQWQKSFGGAADDFANAIAQTNDGGYIINGRSSSISGDVTGNHGSSDYWVVKIDSLGTLEWQKAYGGSAYDAGYHVQQTTDNGYVLSGYASSADGDIIGNHGNKDFWVVKLDNLGLLLWQKSMGGTGIEYGFWIEATSDGGYICSGSSTSNDGDVTGNHGAKDFWIVKLNGTTSIEETSNNLNLLSVFPNPSSEIFNIQIASLLKNTTIEIYNSSGELIYNQKNCTEQNIINLKNQSPGIYFVKITCDNKIISTQKIIKQ